MILFNMICCNLVSIKIKHSRTEDDIYYNKKKKERKTVYI